MAYNPEQITGKRPRAGEVWLHKETNYPVRVYGRRTVSALFALGRRSKLSECEDLASLVWWGSPDGKASGTPHESEFVKEFKYYRTPCV
jgi:hypothetical protein